MHPALRCTSLLAALALLLLLAPACRADTIVHFLHPIPKTFDTAVSQIAMQDAVFQKGSGNVPMEEMVGVWARSFARLGYDFDASVYRAVHDGGTQEYHLLNRTGGLAYIIPVFNALKEDRWAYMVQNGWIRNRTAQAAVDFANRIGMTIRATQPAGLTDAPSQLELAEQTTLKGSRILCGIVARYSSPVASVNHVWFTDMEGNDMGDFFFSNGDESCQTLVQEDQAICFSYIGDLPNTLGLEALGLTDKTLRWIRNCTEPN